LNKRIPKSKDDDAANPLYLDKEYYGYVFVYDATDLDTLKKIVPIIAYIEKAEKQDARVAVTAKKLVVANKIDKRPFNWREKFKETDENTITE